MSFWNRPEVIFILFTFHLYVLNKYPTISHEMMFPLLPIWVFVEVLIIFFVEKVILLIPKRF